MAIKRDVSAAKPEDIGVLVEIMISALESDPWQRFMFSAYRDESTRLQKQMFTPVMEKRFAQDSTCRFVKATDVETGRIVGFATFTWVATSDPEDHIQRLADSSQPGPEAFSVAFSRDCTSRYVRLMKDTCHVVLNSLYILPSYQGQGIGTHIVQWAFNEYELHEETIFVQSLPGSKKFYERLGWQVRDETLLDLSRWAGKGKGYGEWGAPQLVKGPGRLFGTH